MQWTCCRERRAGTGLDLDVPYHSSPLVGDFQTRELLRAVDTTGIRMAPFHLIERGDCWLRLAGQAPTRLQAGDLVVLPHDCSRWIRRRNVLTLYSILESPLLNRDGRQD